MEARNVLKIEDYEHKQSGINFVTKLQPIERLIWLYIQNHIENKSPVKWKRESMSMLQDGQSEDDFAKIICNMVNEGWVSGEEALRYGYSLIQKTDIYLNG
tara:strand:+ start:146 stop:448 length:303 start_codon:yes stop_codon:yes gene_type:complete